ncbi:MAG: 3-isopropylmalate dehydratase small subunit [Synechococcales cyanobacterium]
MDAVIQTVRGRGIPLLGNDIDTDRIIPARFLRCVTFDGLGEQVFIDDRTQLAGQHPFDQPLFQGATILVVNGNFGCGSSREHAPQALARWGIQAIIGESFAEIFAGNCLALGIPCVTASADAIQELQQYVAAHPGESLTLDLTTLTVQWESQQTAVQVNSGTLHMLLSGSWDACGQLVAQLPQVQRVAAELPYTRW